MPGGPARHPPAARPPGQRPPGVVPPLGPIGRGPRQETVAGRWCAPCEKVLGGHAGLGTLGHSGEQVGHEVGAAALPAGPSKHRGDGVLQPLVGIGGYQLHPAEAPSGQRPQEGQPERAVLAGPHVHTQDLTLPFGIDPRRHHHADVDDATALPNLLRQAVQPHVGVGTTVQGPTQETLHHFVQLLADARHLLLEMPSQPRALIRSSTRRVDTPSI